jgi:hypothetical protein
LGVGAGRQGYTLQYVYLMKSNPMSGDNISMRLT